MSRIMVFSLFLLAVSSAARLSEGEEKSPAVPDPEGQQLLERIAKENSAPPWTYAELTHRADLIVIGQVKSQAEIGWDPTIAGEFGDTSVQCVATTMKSLACLKGKADREIEVVTIKWKPDVVVLVRHDFANFVAEFPLPVLVTVEIEGKITAYGAAKPIELRTIHPEYLLFLQKRKDGRYEPVTGQRYSALSSKVLND